MHTFVNRGAWNRRWLAVLSNDCDQTVTFVGICHSAVSNTNTMSIGSDDLNVFRDLLPHMDRFEDVVVPYSHNSVGAHDVRWNLELNL